jgi:hypothetical protein
MGGEETVPQSAWQHRHFSKEVPPESHLGVDQNPRAVSPKNGLNSRVDFSAFINSMDDESFSYLCLIREYASRELQGRASEYGGLYKAIASQTADEETTCRVSVIEFSGSGLRSRTFVVFNEFKNYLDEITTHSREPLKRLLVMEDMLVRYICLLGSRMRVHPTVFARHYTSEDSSSISDNIISLPSIVQTSTSNGLGYESDDEDLHKPNKKRSFTLRCPVLMPRVSAKQHPGPLRCPPWLKPNARLREKSAYPRFIVERGLETPTKYDQWDTRGDISELESQVTYRYHMLPKGGWEG